MNCLVTGAAGFIGNALTHRLASEGHHVRAILHRNNPTSLPPSVIPIYADITDPSTLSKVVLENDIVFHCAALVNDYGPKKQFMDVNFHGTQYLAEACDKKIKRFIFLGHIPYESTVKSGNYSRSKALAVQYLLERYQKERFPVVIINPGNVYGPGTKTWVLRLLRAIQQNRIRLVNHGQGIFLHTYIDNLIDALLAALQAPSIEGEVFNVTDGDNTITWGQYINDLAAIASKPPVTKNLSGSTALLLSKMMMLSYYLFHTTPFVTPQAVYIFLNERSISIQKAQSVLGYAPRVDYQEGMQRVHRWLQKEHYV